MRKRKQTSLPFRTYRMPNGEETYDSAKYVAAWRACAAGIEKSLGWKLCAFDPDLRFRKPNGHSEDVSQELANLVNDFMAAREKEIVKFGDGFGLDKKE